MTSRAHLQDEPLAEQMQQIEQLIQHLETVDPDARKAAQQLIQLLMDLNASGLERMLEIVTQSGAAGEEILRRLGRDPLAASLLFLYGLHPVDLATRVNQALDKVRPLLHSHGGDVELVEIDEGVVRLRLQGSCHGCPSSAMTLRQAIEESLFELAPDIIDLEVAGVVEEGPPSLLVQLTAMRPNGGADSQTDLLAANSHGKPIPTAPVLAGAPAT